MLATPQKPVNLPRNTSRNESMEEAGQHVAEGQNSKMVDGTKKDAHDKPDEIYRSYLELKMNKSAIKDSDSVDHESDRIDP